MRFLRSLSLVAFACALAVTCDGPPRSPGGPTPPPPPQQGPVLSVVNVDLTGETTFAPGTTQQMTMTAIRSDASREDVTATTQWSTSTGSILSVVGPGRYQANRTGDGSVSARFGTFFRGRGVVIVPDGTFRVTGRVFETGTPTALISGAQVLVRDRDAIGPHAETDIGGFFRLYGVRPESDFIVTRTGYRETIKGVKIDRHTSVDVEMGLAGPRLELSGVYTVTFTFDACTNNYRSELRQRTYKAELVQSGSNVEVRFVEPEFAVNTINRGASIPGRVDPTGFTLQATTGFYYYYYYGPSSYPNLVERLTDSTRLVVSGTGTMRPSANGFEGEFRGRSDHWGARYPQDTWFGSCNTASVVFTR